MSKPLFNLSKAIAEMLIQPSFFVVFFVLIQGCVYETKPTSSIVSVAQTFQLTGKSSKATALVELFSDSACTTKIASVRAVNSVWNASVSFAQNGTYDVFAQDDDTTIPTQKACLYIKTVTKLEPAIAPYLPPMGWNSWNAFSCNVDAEKVKGVADAIVSSGMREAGYKYVTIDDCWQVSRDANGNIQADPVRFPQGIKALADYVHSKNLKFGIYTSTGPQTCQLRPGSYGYYDLDIQTYAAWGVDFIKADYCSSTPDGKSLQDNFREFSAALRRTERITGRSMVLSISQTGSTQPWIWAPGVGMMWRTTYDITPDWERIMSIYDQNVVLADYSALGRYNDADMLEVGHPALPNLDENMAHFSLWAMMNTPLIAGNDLRSASAATLSILNNHEVIAINQDPLAQQARIVSRPGSGLEVLSKNLVGVNRRAVALFNRNSTHSYITVNFSDLRLPNSNRTHVRDIWNNKDAVVSAGAYTAEVRPHSVVLLAIKTLP